MKKNLLLFVFSVASCIGYAQTDRLWSSVENTTGIKTSKSIERASFPKEYKLFQLNLDNLRQSLFTATSTAKSTGVVVTIPNLDGQMERFRVFESSNFAPELQAQFPDIRAYVGLGIDDKNAQIRLSSAPNGIQAMVFRTDKRNEFMEPYSEDAKIYAVYNSSRMKGKLPFTCSTEDVAVLNRNIEEVQANNGQLKTFRLAMSCTGEYTTYHGGTVAGALAAINATMTRVNGVFERDFAVRMNLIANNNLVIYTNAGSDPYSPDTAMNNWNAELQATLTSVIGEANYDVGHLFGASGGGGNAGCIGCVCVDGQKGSGITSPADGVPMGDNFDIDYVAHELGHQFGGNHTFSHSAENNAVNVEPGSGSTIMGYAGITGATDVQAHSDDYFAYRSILQVQTNLNGKTCPVVTTLTNQAPTMTTAGNFTIPLGTPFILTGSGTDPNGDTLSYCWEQNNDATTVGAASSYVSPTKTNGPNFRSLDPKSIPVRYMPKLESVLNNLLTSEWESVNNNARTSQFTLTGRDNVAGPGTAGQTGTAACTITTSGTIGPFNVTSQGTAGISWTQGTNQTITWVTNGAETLAGSTTVDILLSTDGGLNFTTTLASGVPNDGSETVVAPNVAATNCRIMVKPTGNIYYDVNTTPFAIGYIITNTCNTYSGTSLPIVTAAGFPANQIGTVSVPMTGQISSVSVFNNITHTYLSDVITDISSPTNPTTFVKAFNRSCGSTNGSLNLKFTAGGAAINCTAGGTTLQTVTPGESFAAFNGQNPQGTWKLRVYDTFTGDNGTLNSWSIEICTQQVALITEDFGLDNFSIFPNPNNGNFSVKFDSKSSNEIAIEVHDIRGRQIFNKVYQNTGLFEQNVQLNNVETGVYMVTVKDGNRKEVKKIVIE